MADQATRGFGQTFPAGAQPQRDLPVNVGSPHWQYAWHLGRMQAPGHVAALDALSGGGGLQLNIAQVTRR